MDPHATDDTVTEELEAPDATAIAAPNEPELMEGEVVESNDAPPISISFTPGSTGSSGTDTLIATQNIINRQTAKLDELRVELKKLNESAKSILENDQLLAQIEDEVKEVSKKQKERKASLAQSPESMNLKYKAKDVKESMKELEESLNNHLISYFQLTGTKVFDTEAGEQREFKITARVMSKKQQD